MLAASGAGNTSGKSVTTLIVSIGLFHRDEMIAPRLHHGARRDAQEPEQPLAVVGAPPRHHRSEEHTSELQSPCNLVCRLLLEKKKKNLDMLLRKKLSVCDNAKICDAHL